MAGFRFFIEFVLKENSIIEATEMISFLVFGDLHYDHIPDGKERVQELAEAIREERPDFVLSLGDLCSPVQQNLPVRRALESAGCPVYYALGNHDGDQQDLCTTADFFSLSRSWYSFIVQDVKFIVLYAGLSKKAMNSFRFSGATTTRQPISIPFYPMRNWIGCAKRWRIEISGM